MSWYPDLGTETMIDSGPHVRAIGWLSSKYPYPTGDVPTDVLERIKLHVQHWLQDQKALNWHSFRGLHQCELCQQFRSYGNIGVPAGEVLYVFPEMLAHYIEVHHYLPPAEFMAALMTSPLPGTPEYVEACLPFRKSES